MAKWYKVAAGLMGAGLIASCGAWAFWPELAEGFARDKAVEVLERRFDIVKFGCFELGREALHICDIHLEKGSVNIDIEEVDVAFQVRWSLEPQVVVAEVAARGGKLEGELEKIRELRSSGAETAPPSRSRIELEGVELSLEDLEFDILHEEFQFKSHLDASSLGLEGPFALELTDLEVLEGAQVRGRAGTLTVELEREDPFPLELKLEEAEATYEKLVVQNVGGRLVLEDAELERLTADFHGQTGAGQSWSLEGSLDRATKRVDIRLSAQDIKPQQLPGAHLLPLVPDRGLVSGSISLKGSRKKVHLEGDVAIEGVQVDHPRLSLEPVVIDNRVVFAGSVDLEARELQLERASVTLGPDQLVLTASGRVHHSRLPEEREYELEARLESVPCQSLLESVPPGLAPALEGFELGAHTDVDLRVAVKMSDPEATVLEGGIDIDSCRILKVPPTMSSLKGAFSHVVKMKTGRTVTRLLGRGAGMYTPYDRIPSSVPGAVVSTEDGGFWKHDGFIKSQFRASLKRNVELGTFRRGASTITMQMVKNVLLTQEKTVSRKLQELFLTWVVERRLSKQRIMEIYLNVVEFGPGIYGVGDAAEHYFDKLPLELTSLESAFLASLLPRPVERHEMWCRGELTPRHDKYIRRVHRRMLARGRITQEGFDAALGAPFVFSRRGWFGESACLAQGRAVAEGPHTQGAISGLLLGRPEG